MAKHHERTGPEAGQVAMFDEGDLTAMPSTTPGRHATDVDRALRATGLDESDLAAATLLTAGAWALDRFEIENKPYGPSKLIPPMVEALRELHMTPDSRPEEQVDTFDALLAELNADDDAADTAAPVRNEA